ncbi:TonB-dependent hemoglobin/transferrin/lactoferrin family receptor [Paenochrobactrum pullorum]|uniref:TonB-dependent hemoglobin/transferrin/lactoferrin family receptor n=1 Tax=Paenochrobactrum pullorum TaxID=1324351 RepID=UPI0035BC974B
MLAKILSEASVNRRWLRALSASVAFLACTAVQAQSVPNQTAAKTEQTKPDKDPDAINLKMITVSSERTIKKLLDIPMSISIIDRDTLERHQVRDIQDLVRYEPGVNVNRTTSLTNPFAQLNSFNIRGVGGNRVQMLVDGGRVQEFITDGSRDLVDPFNMKSVEITRGPNSVLWGADALGGVVYFRTLDPDDLLDGTKPWAVESKLAYDSFDKSFRQQITGAAEAGDFKILGSFGHMSADEPHLRKARADGGIWGCPREAIWPCNKTQPMDVSAYNGLMKLQWNPTEDHEVKLTAEWFRRTTDVDQKYDSGAANPMYASNPAYHSLYYENERYDRSVEMQRSRFAIEHRWSTPAEWLDEVKWSFSYSPQKRDMTSEQIRNYTLLNPAKRERREQIRNYSEDFLQADIQLTSSFDLGQTEHKLIYGFAGDITKTNYDGTNITTNLNTGAVTIANRQGFNFPKVDTVRADFYVQDEIKLLDDRLTITPGLRLATYSIDPTKDDDYNPIDGFEPEKIDKTRLVKRLGALYKLDNTYSLFGSYGEGFKMPTSQQLFVSSQSIGTTGMVEVVPNPNLKPEFVRSYELGVRGEYDRGYFSFSGFYADYKDFIRGLQPVPNESDKYTSDNVSSVQIWGVEFGGEYEIYNNLMLNAAISYMRGDQRLEAGADKTPFDGAVPLTAVFGLRYLIPDWNLETEFVGTFAKGVSRRADPDTYKPSGYAVFDAYARWKPTKNIDLNFGVENIFDKRYFPNTLTNYANSASSAVANANPLEMQVEPGRTFKLGATMRF